MLACLSDVASVRELIRLLFKVFRGFPLFLFDKRLKLPVIKIKEEVEWNTVYLWVSSSPMVPAHTDLLIPF